MNFILIMLSFASAQLWVLVTSRITKEHFHLSILFSDSFSLSFRCRNMNFMFLIIKLEQIYNLINNEVVKKIFGYVSLIIVSSHKSNYLISFSFLNYVFSSWIQANTKYIIMVEWKTMTRQMKKRKRWRSEELKIETFRKQIQCDIPFLFVDWMDFAKFTTQFLYEI